MEKKKQSYLIIVGVIVILIVGGYFIFLSKSSDSSVIPKIKESSKDVSELVLDLSDLPEDYKIIVKGPRTKSDISESGLNLGWKEGYRIAFATGEGTIFDFTTISQAVSKYPIENISLVLDDLFLYYEEKGYVIEELPNPYIGDKSIASKLTEEDFGIGTYQIEFVKKDIYMSFKTRGNYELLEELAKKAEAKI